MLLKDCGLSHYQCLLKEICPVQFFSRFCGLMKGRILKWWLYKGICFPLSPTNVMNRLESEINWILKWETQRQTSLDAGEGLGPKGGTFHAFLPSKVKMNYGKTLQVAEFTPWFQFIWPMVYLISIGHPWLLLVLLFLRVRVGLRRLSPSWKLTMRKLWSATWKFLLF